PKNAVEGSLGETGRDTATRNASELAKELEKLKGDESIPKALRESALGIIAVRLERIRGRIIDGDAAPSLKMSRLSGFYAASAKWVAHAREALKVLGTMEAEGQARRTESGTR